MTGVKRSIVTNYQFTRPAPLPTLPPLFELLSGRTIYAAYVHIFGLINIIITNIRFFYMYLISVRKFNTRTLKQPQYDVAMLG